MKLDYSSERSEFIRLTSNMNIFLNKNGNFYAEYHLFLANSLLLILDRFPSFVRGWWEVARRCADKDATLDEIREVRAEIIEFRKQQLGLDGFSEEVMNEVDAMTVLFFFALEHQDENGINCNVPTSVVQAIDEFTMVFIEFFGFGKRLAIILSESFEVNS